MSDLIKTIEKLSREEVLEAAQNLTLRITQNATDAERKEELRKTFIEKPNENVREIEELARLILLVAGANSKSAEEARWAIDAARREDLSDGGVSIVVLATLGVFTLNLLVTKRDGPNRRTIEIEEKGDRTSFVVEEGISYGISRSLGLLLKTYFRRP